jgi:hypothetical protein
MKVEINVPENLEQITLEQYQRFMTIYDRKDIDEFFLMQKMIQIFCKVELAKVVFFKASDIKEIIASLHETLNKAPKFTKRFSFAGTDYGFIPNLDEITMGEYIDLEENLQDWGNLHKAMAVLYRPVIMEKGDRYTIEKYQGIKNESIMKEIPAEYALGASLFFWNLRTELSETILKYLSKEMKEALTHQQKEVLLENGVGFNHYMLSLTEMLNELKISQNY